MAHPPVRAKPSHACKGMAPQHHRRNPRGQVERRNNCLPESRVPRSLRPVIAPEKPTEESQLIRALGVPSLAANIVNSTVGAGIFALPALVAAQMGAGAPLAFLACALAMVIFVTSFAIAGSRVSLTGGLYAYVETAFGRYIGFIAGVLYFLTAILAASGIVALIADTI